MKKFAQAAAISFGYFCILSTASFLGGTGAAAATLVFTGKGYLEMLLDTLE